MDVPSGDERVTVIAEIRRSDIPALCALVARQLDDRGDDDGDVVCELAGLARPDVVVVDALARMQLVARMRGARLMLRSPGAELGALLELAGLDGSVIEVIGQPEQGEKLAAEEVRDPTDRPA